MYHISSNLAGIQASVLKLSLFHVSECEMQDGGLALMLGVCMLCFN